MTRQFETRQRRHTLTNNNHDCSAHAEKQNHSRDTARILQHTKGVECTANGRCSKTGLTDAENIGGRNKAGISNNRKFYGRGKVYDPLLGRHPIPVIVAPNLLEQIVADTNFMDALVKVNSEPDKAPGCDHRSIRDVCVPLLNDPEAREKIRQQILQGKYVPNAVRITEIPKANGKKRKLGIATVLDRVIQTMILQAVETNTPDQSWSEYSYAYRKNRSVANAISEVDKIMEEGYEYGILLDLKAFFDHVPHDRLIAKLRKHLADKRVVALVCKFLTPIMRDRQGRATRNRIGSPQGSVVSPWLTSMLYLDELDRELERRGLRFVRYADDITVFCRTRRAARRIKVGLINYIETTLRCPVNRDKTKIERINHISLLGVAFKRGKWHIQREKLKARCSDFLGSLYMAKKTGDVAYLVTVSQRMRGFINFYNGIPDTAAKEVPRFKRWCLRKWKSVLAGTEWAQYDLFRYLKK